MAIGQYLSLEQARKKGKLDRFAKEHPSTGDKAIFDNLFQAMAKTPKEVSGTSRPDSCEDYNETQTHLSIYQDA